jgi:hypothetical protein
MRIKSVVAVLLALILLSACGGDQNKIKELKIAACNALSKYESQGGDSMLKPINKRSLDAALLNLYTATNKDIWLVFSNTVKTTESPVYFPEIRSATCG